MATLGNKKRIVVKKSDLNKAIVSKNATLKASNANLEKRLKAKELEIKDAQSKLDNINNDYRKFYDENDRLSKDIVKLESKLIVANEDLNTALESASKAISSESEAYKSKEKILKEHSKLSKESSKMNAYKDKYKKLTKDLSMLKQNIGEDLEEIALLKSDKTKLAKQKRDAVNRYNNALEKEEMVKVKLEVEEVAFKVKLEAINKELSLQEASNNRKISELNEQVDSKNKELDELNSIIDKTKDDYIKQEAKVNVAKNNVFEEEARIDIVKENFEKWKISALEEVAKMKLKGKMESIDKAGLKEVLNG